MAHDVRFSVTERELSNYPIIFSVKKYGRGRVNPRHWKQLELHASWLTTWVPPLPEH